MNVPAAPNAFRGVLVATTTPFRDGTVDLTAFQVHCRWLVDNGVHGVVPNGSLGEYQSLTDSERADLVRAAVEAVGADAVVVPGVGAPGGDQSRRWAEQAAEAGAHGVLALPPTGYKAGRAEILAHFHEVAAAGLPIIVYNNPYSTHIDLVPELLAEIATIDAVVAVKEFSGDVRRVSELLDRAPRLDIYAGADDVLLESLLAGALGWIAGMPNAFPRESVRLFELGVAGKVEEALPLYRAMLPILRWDSKPPFVQAIKRTMDLVGRYGGPCRLPRLPLDPPDDTAVRTATRQALTALERSANQHSPAS